MSERVEDAATAAPPAAAKPAESRLEAMTEAAFGIDFKLPRTLRDLVIQPGRVADAALAGDNARYTPQLKVFFILFAALVPLIAFIGAGDGYTIEGLLGANPEALAIAQAQLEAAGSSIAEADGVVRRWWGWLNWPISVGSTLLYAVAIWLMRRSLGFWRAFQLYLTGTNAHSVVIIPLALLALPFGQTGLGLFGLLTMLLFYLYCGLVMHRRAADSATGLALRIGGLVLATIPVLILAVVAQVAVLELAMRMETGASRIDVLYGSLIQASIAAAGG